jgi:hypothetical protein
MRRLILFFLILLPAGRLAAQKTLFEIPVGWRKNVVVFAVSDRSKQQNCLFLLNGDSIRVILLDSKAAVVQQFYLPRLSNERFLGSFIKDSKIYAFLSAKGDEPHLHGWTLDISSGNGDDYDIPFDIGHDREVEAMSDGDRFIYFTVNKKTSEFTLYNFRDGKNCDTSHYQSNDSLWIPLTNANGFSRIINVAAPAQDRENMTESAQVPNKIYLTGDTLYLLMNGRERGLTHVLSFEMAHKQFASTEIVHNEMSYQTPPLLHYEDNSFLLDGKLYFVSAIKDSLCVQIRDFYSGTLIHQYAVGKKEEISFKNTPIRYASSSSKFSRKEWSETSKLINEMVGGSAVIVAGRDDSNRIVVSVRSYRELRSGGGMMMGGPGSAPVMIPGSAGGSSSAGFNMLLDGNTLDHISGSMGPTIEEKIEQYKDGIELTPEDDCLLESNGKQVYVYYDRAKRKLVVVSF